MFEWDDTKNRRNLAQHGIDFDFATRIFEGPYDEILDDRIEYGEDRYIATGFSVTKSTLLCIVFDMVVIASSRLAPRPGRKPMPTIVRSRQDIETRRYPGVIDRERVDALTDEDIRRQIARDPDLAPELTEADFARARTKPPLIRSKIAAEETG